MKRRLGVLLWVCLILMFSDAPSQAEAVKHQELVIQQGVAPAKPNPLIIEAMNNETQKPPQSPDVNNDGEVNVFDLVLVGSSFGRKPGEEGYVPQADVTGDGEVNLFDLQTVANAMENQDKEQVKGNEVVPQKPPTKPVTFGDIKVGPPEEYTLEGVAVKDLLTELEKGNKQAAEILARAKSLPREVTKFIFTELSKNVEPYRADSNNSRYDPVIDTKLLILSNPVYAEFSLPFLDGILKESDAGGYSIFALHARATVTFETQGEKATMEFLISALDYVKGDTAYLYHVMSRIAHPDPKSFNQPDFLSGLVHVSQESITIPLRLPGYAEVALREKGIILRVTIKSSGEAPPIFISLPYQFGTGDIVISTSKLGDFKGKDVYYFTDFAIPSEGVGWLFQW